MGQVINFYNGRVRPSKLDAKYYALVIFMEANEIYDLTDPNLYARV